MSLKLCCQTCSQKAVHCQALITTACWMSLQDLLTDEKFTRKEIIHIQDPMNLQVCIFTCLPLIRSGLVDLV